jgi:predicted ArsR family transcriptional regulator
MGVIAGIRDDAYHAALASPTRRRVLDALRHSPIPLDASAVAGLLGLHVTTARFHLDQLTAAHLARRSTSAEHRRGRPRVLFAPAGPVRNADAREQLIEVLASAVREGEAMDAGRRWADELRIPDASDPAAAVFDILDRLGFAPEAEPAATTIRLRACPFRSAAREHPEVVCTVHRGMVERLLEGRGPRPGLLPFVEPELCLVTLGDRATGMGEP